MPGMTTFDSTKEHLQDTLRSIATGATQLPDFQRGWVWDDEHIRSLLASISLSHPIGAVMLLEAGNDEVRFKPRLVEGVTGVDGVQPSRLILDGQQRLTSLFLALASGKPVPTRDARDNAIKRWYYIDIHKALNPNVDREEAVIALPEERILRNFRGQVLQDYSRPELEFEAGLFPLTYVFKASEWRNPHNKFWNYSSEKVELFDRFEAEVIERFKQYQIPVIQLKKETPKEAVCQVFERVNTGGVSLTVFELMTATFAAEDYSLRDDWLARKKRLSNHRVLQGVGSDPLLQAVTLLATFARRTEHLRSGGAADSAPAIGCKRKEILRLTLAEYRRWVEPATQAFERVAKFLYRQKILAVRDIPYQTQLTPLAAVLAVLGDEADKDHIRAKLERWFWCGVFGELYGSTIETRFARDLPEILAWVEGGPEPTTVQEANLVPDRLLSLRTRNSAAYKGLHALLLRDGALDFRSGEAIDAQQYFDERIDIHHIFPREWCRKNGVDDKLCESIINKTPISAKTNRIIGGRAPSVYLEALQRQAGMDETRMDEILASHAIDPLSLRLDEFQEFFAARREALLKRIERAMGKPVLRNVGPEEAGTPIENVEAEEVVDS